MLMAAGRGTRLQPFTHYFPKALIPVMGIPVAQFAVDSLCKYGIKKIVANIHHCPEISKNGLRSLDVGNAKLELSDESTLLLGSAGGIRKALPLLGDEPFFLLNADVVCDIDLFELAKHHRERREKQGALLTLAIGAHSPANEKSPSGGEYREIILDDKREKIISLGTLARNRPFYTGVAVLESEIISSLPLDQPMDFVTDLLLPAISAGKVGAYFCNSNRWYDIGSPQLWLETHLALIAGLENNALSHSIPTAWLERITSKNIRTAPEIWCSKDFEPETKLRHWKKPCYWGSFNSKSFDDKAKANHSHLIKTLPPQKLGPNAVLYGNPPIHMNKFENGIGFGESWEFI